MKKIMICFVVSLFLLFSTVVNAENRAEFTYTSFDDLLILDLNTVLELGGGVVVKVSAASSGKNAGIFNNYDFLGGFTFDQKLYKSKLVTHYTWLTGIRIGENGTGLVLNQLERINFTDKVFLDSDVEYVYWSKEPDVVLVNELIGYKLASKLVGKGGISIISSNWDFDFGLTLGVESSF